MTTVTAKQEDISAIFGSIKSIIDEATFQLTPDGLVFRGMDHSHFMLLDVNMPKSEFVNYEVESTLSFGVKTEEFNRFIKRIKGTVTLTVRDDNRLEVAGDGKTFIMRLVGAMDSSLNVPKMEFPVKATVETATLKEVLKDLQTFAEYIEFSAGENKLTAYAEYDGTEAITPVKCEFTGEGRASYNLGYVNSILLTVADEFIRVEYGTQKPLRLTFGRGFIQYWLGNRQSDSKN